MGGLIAAQHEAGEVVLLFRRIAKPGIDGGIGFPPQGIGTGGEPVVVFHLQPVEGRGCPADRQIGAVQFGHGRIQHGRREDQRQGFHRGGRHIGADRGDKGGGRLGQQRAGGIEKRGLGGIERRAHVGDGGRGTAERAPGRFVIKADAAVGKVHHQGSPTWKRTGAPAATISPATALPTDWSQSIAGAQAGESRVEGGSQPVSAAWPSRSRCFQPAGACWSSTS